MKAQNLTSGFFLPSLSDLGDLYGFTNAFDTMGVCKKNSGRKSFCTEDLKRTTVSSP